MMKNRLSIILSTASALTLAFLASSHAQEKVGINAVIENANAISITDFENNDRAVLEEGDAFLNDTISSGEDALMQILLLDEKTITIGQNCEFVIDKFVYNPADNTGEMVASVTKGAFRFMSGKPASSRSRTTLRTPVASMGVRGTVVEGAVGQRAVDIAQSSTSLPEDMTIDGENASLIILRGPSKDQKGLDNQGALDVMPPNGGSNSGASRSPGGRDGDVPPVTITSGTGIAYLRAPNTAVFIPYKNGPIIGPFALSKASFVKFSEDLRTVPFGAPEFELPLLTTIARGSGDQSEDGDYGFPWKPEDQPLNERPDLEDTNGFVFPPGPPICPPGTPAGQPGCP